MVKYAEIVSRRSAVSHKGASEILASEILALTEAKVRKLVAYFLDDAYQYTNDPTLFDAALAPLCITSQIKLRLGYNGHNTCLAVLWIVQTTQRRGTAGRNGLRRSYTVYLANMQSKTLKR